jgi:hypothetical protein
MPYINRFIGKESYGFRIFGFRIIRNSDTAFGKLVAQQAYNLTHELVTNKLWQSGNDFRFTGHTDAAWMELDRAVKEFADTY